MKNSGRTHYSGYPIFYHMRFEHDLVTKGDPFKINNNYLSMLIRLLIYRCPEFDGWFELREIRMKGVMRPKSGVGAKTVRGNTLH